MSSPSHLHHVIGDQDRLCLALPRAQAVEVGRVIGPQQDRLAVEHDAIDRQRSDSMTNASEGGGVI
jgi:hypothetical protein